MGGADNLIDPQSEEAHQAQYSVCKSRGRTDPPCMSLPRTSAAPQYVCHPAPPSRRSWPVLRYPQLSRRFASANIISLMAELDATRQFSMQPIWVPTALSFLPTGFACALHEPPEGAIARALHAITLLIAHQMVRDLRELGGNVDVFTVPNLCPLNVSPYDFSRADQLIEQAAEHTRKWIEGGGLSWPEIPNSLLPHTH